jgi:GNAT superfamily N-acetyltransferase
VTESGPIRIVRLSGAEYQAAIPDLAALVVDAVAGGAGVNFLAGVGVDEAAGWWSARVESVEAGTVTPLVAFDGPRLVGSVILIRATNPNSPHRAEIGKVLVHRTVRRRGIGAALMHAVEALARAEGRWLLVLDTETGSAGEALYRSLGWVETGIVPDYALAVDGQPAAATFFWKDLR